MTVALELPAIAAVVTLNVADVAEAATVAEAGTVRTAFVLARVTAAPPVGAACDKVMVQIPVELAARVVGAHDTEVMDVGATKLIVTRAGFAL